MAARRTQDLACKEFICCSRVSGSGNTTSHQKQPCLQQMMMCKECRQFGRFAYTRCDWLTPEAVHAHKPSATCSLHLYHIASFEQAAAGHAALPGHMCDIQGFPIHSPPPTPPHPHPILLTAMDTKVTQTRQHLLSSSPCRVITWHQWRSSTV